ncbi:hypothetical protein KSS87_011993 [Heliosperma pusillum]|nr:hypothetical protein KSS87_020631 [Heliosperma pusillum]KAH9617071.1 hypothetical protein KSS87_011993 [Heliosperma pusillum]
MVFTGTLDKCKACDKAVYVVDMVSADGVPYHKTCFKCTHCNSKLMIVVEGENYHKACFRCAKGGCFLNASNYAALDGYLYCKPHFAQLFKEKGSYNHLAETISVQKNEVISTSDEEKLESTPKGEVEGEVEVEEDKDMTQEQ